MKKKKAKESYEGHHLFFGATGLKEKIANGREKLWWATHLFSQEDNKEKLGGRKVSR